MIKEEAAKFEDQIKEVVMVCPECHNKDTLQIPRQIINQSKQLTTVSIPTGVICEHSFQAFIDKNFKVRGYQKVDFELSKMEYFGDSVEGTVEESKEETTIQATITPLFARIINILRKFIDENINDTMGSAIFTLEGKVVYSSLPLDTLYNTIREFETRNEKNLILVKKLFLLLENDHKIFTQFLEILEHKLIILLMFNENIKLGMGNLLLNNIIKDIKNTSSN
jgi:hypothetical protein